MGLSHGEVRDLLLFCSCFGSQTLIYMMCQGVVDQMPFVLQLSSLPPDALVFDLEPDNHNDCIAFGRQYDMEAQLDQWVPVLFYLG